MKNVQEITVVKIMVQQILTIEFQRSIILLQPRHFTLTASPGSRSNLFEPQFGQIGHARIGSINAQWVLYPILILHPVFFWR